MRSYSFKIGARVLRVELSDRPGDCRLDARVLEEREGGERELLGLASIGALQRGKRVDLLGAGGLPPGLAVFASPSAGEICIEGLRYPVQDADLAEEAEAGEAHLSGPDVRAPMPGRVVKLLVEPGARVARGSPLLILESMKMETEIPAGVPGTVGSIPVGLGQNVNPGELLVEIHPEPRLARSDA